MILPNVVEVLVFSLVSPCKLLLAVLEPSAKALYTASRLLFRAVVLDLSAPPAGPAC